MLARNRMRPLHGSLGVSVAPPKIGEPLFIEMHDNRGVRITTPVTRVIARTDGVVVHTLRSRYLVANSGDAYLIVD